MKIYAINTETLKTMQEEAWTEWICLLDGARRERIEKLKQKEDRIQSIGAGLLLRYSFLQEGYTEQEWEKVKIQCGPSGKPRLVQYPDFCYSLSHSGEWVICGVHSKELGADIQVMRPWKEKVAERFFAREEYERIQCAELSQQQKTFYRLWTAKESYGKLTGYGIGKGISQYLVAEDMQSITDTERGESATIRCYEVISDYMICICTNENNVFPSKIEIISFRDLK